MSFLKPTPSKSSSYNTNEGLITSDYSPTISAGTGATNFLAQLLGVSPSGVSSTAGRIGTAANGIAAAGGAPAGYDGRMFTPGLSVDGKTVVAPQTGEGLPPGVSYAPGAGGAGGAGGGDALSGFDQYKSLAGYAPALREMQRGITGGAAAAGLLNSGSTGKALVKYGGELDSQYFNNYLQQLAGLAGIGLQGGGLVANVGQRQKQTGGSPSTVGSIASTVGGIASIFSDRRLKQDVVELERFPDGLGVYAFRYLDDAEIRIGVMADEVEAIRPWALGPIVGGFATVNYGAL